MTLYRIRKIPRCERGIALPMAMITLMILSVLIIAFTMLAASEPVLAGNQLQIAQARAIAESGLERAIWALNNPADPAGIPNPLVAPAAPYNGSAAIAVTMAGVQLGVYTVSVTNGANANQRNIVLTGWAPTNIGNGSKARQKIIATVATLRFLDPPAALTVRGEIAVGGNSLVDSRSDSSCGNKSGTWSQGATTVDGSAEVYGRDGDNVPNGSGDRIQNLPATAFDPYTYTNAELSAIKAFAKANGTYYQGAVTFNAGHKLPNGIIYIDTVSGQNIDTSGPNTTPTSDFASVDIHGNSEADSSGVFSGWIIVAGSLAIAGDFHMRGMLYVLNDMVYTGTGTGRIDGAIITQNIRDTSSTTIDTNTGGNASVHYDCHYAKTGGGQVPQTFTIQAGTYKEIPG